MLLTEAGACAWEVAKGFLKIQPAATNIQGQQQLQCVCTWTPTSCKFAHLCCCITPAVPGSETGTWSECTTVAWALMLLLPPIG